MSRKIGVSVDNGLVTLCDEELDAVAAGASTFTFNVNSSQTGNANSTGTVNLILRQGQTGQDVTFNGTFGTT